MDDLFKAYIFLLGLAVGSFLNVVVFRYHTGRGLSGRSFCGSCGRKLTWIDLVPVLSFLFLRGRCRTCRARVSWQYPFVELFTGLVFLLTFKVFLDSFLGIERWVVLLAHLVSWPLLIVMLVYDFRHKIIPDAFVYGFAFVALAYRLALSFLAGFNAPVWADIAAGPILFLPFFLLWFLSRGKWMGFGDAKLALGIGWFLGLGGGISAVILGFWVGAVVGVLLMAIHRLRAGHSGLTMKSEIPFGPFLVAGVFAVSFLNFSLFALVLLDEVF